MKALQTPLTLLAAITLSASLVGCGGGGSDPQTVPVVEQPKGAVDTPNQAGASTPNISGPLSGEAISAFAYLNRLRVASGVGALNYSETLAVAATGHATHNAANQTVSHYQNVGDASFTGVDLEARIAGSGYRASAGGSLEVISAGAPSIQTMDALLSTPYHRIGLMSHEIVDAGIGYSSSTTYQMRTVVNASRTGTQQEWKSNDRISVFPYDGQQNVPTAMANEQPNPYAELGNWCSPSCPGYTISIQAKKGDTVSNASFTVTSQSGVILSGKTLDAASDSTILQFDWKNWAFFIPSTPLNPGETYTVTVSANVSGVYITKSWSFTTKTGRNTINARTYGDVIIADIDSSSGLSKATTEARNQCGADLNYRSATTPSGIIYTILAGGGAGCKIDVEFQDAGNGATATGQVAAE